MLILPSAKAGHWETEKADSISIGRTQAGRPALIPFRLKFYLFFIRGRYFPLMQNSIGELRCAQKNQTARVFVPSQFFIYTKEQ